jgi:hypothetical protein
MSVLKMDHEINSLNKKWNIKSTYSKDKATIKIKMNFM